MEEQTTDCLIQAGFGRLLWAESSTSGGRIVTSALLGSRDWGQASPEFPRLPNGAFVEIDAPHWPLTERPDEVRRAIEDRIERLEAAFRHAVSNREIDNGRVRVFCVSIDIKRLESLEWGRPDYGEP